MPHSFKKYIRDLSEAKKRKKTRGALNTAGADVNEILLGYYMLGGKWTGFQDSKYVKGQLEKRKKQIGEDEYAIQSLRAEQMAKEVKIWTSSRLEYSKSKPVKVWWTARPGVLSKAFGKAVDSRKNPTDTLVQYDNGVFLGLSAKSTKATEPGFKNPGMGTIEKALGVDLRSVLDKEQNKFIKKHNLSTVQSKRKTEIRADSDLVAASAAARDITLRKLRDALMNELKSISQDKLKEHLNSNWMDVDIIGPPYIKVTGKGAKPPFTAKIMDPLEKHAKINWDYYAHMKKVGNDGIGIFMSYSSSENSEHRLPILKMRVKYGSQAMASPIKFSGEDWKG